MSWRKPAAALLALVLLLLPLASRGAESSPAREPGTAADFTSSELMSGRHTQYLDAQETAVSPYGLEGYTLRLQSEELEVWAQEARLRIRDRRSGYLWGLSADEKPQGLNKTWYEMAASLCSVEYYDPANSEKTVSTESAGVQREMEWQADGFLCRVDMPEQGLRFTLEGRLTGDRFRLQVVPDSLEEYGECKIKSLYLMPFLGSTYSNDIQGYFFVPDGCGALLRFQTPTAYSAALEGRIYGPDPGVDSLNQAANLLASRGNDYLSGENPMTLPVFGIVHGEGQNGLLAIVEDGVEQAYLRASMAGVITDYNWVTARFAYRTSYMKPVNKAGTGVYTPQETANTLSPSLEYVFFTGSQADYASMAVYYRERLKAEGALPEGDGQTQTSLWLTLLGAEIREGLLFNTTSVFTTVAEGASITQQLRDRGIRDLNVCYYGWEQGGVNGARYGTLSLEGKLGSSRDLEAWQEALAEQGGRLWLYRNLGRANVDQIRPAAQAAKNISSAYIRYHTDNEEMMYPDAYVIQSRVQQENLAALQNRWPGYPLALDGVGSDPFSDFTRGASATRQETMESQRALLEAAQGPAVFRPSAYQWTAAGCYLDMPMTTSQYLFETDTVPFLQILLKGHLECYSPYLNLGYSSDNALLKLVEYGVNPAFLLGAAESHELEATPQENLFSICFGDWQDRVEEVYDFVAGALDPVAGREITGHRMVAPGVARVGYEGDLEILVNYNAHPVTVEGAEVPAKGYLVRGDGQ